MVECTHYACGARCPPDSASATEGIELPAFDLWWGGLFPFGGVQLAEGCASAQLGVL